MPAVCDRGKCIHCGGCVGICPADAITLEESVIVVDRQKCVDCGACVKYCPVRAMRIEK